MKKVKVTLRHNRTKKIRTEVMDLTNDCYYEEKAKNFYGEVGNKSCWFGFEENGEAIFSIKSYTVIKVEGQTFVWKLKEKKK